VVARKNGNIRGVRKYNNPGKAPGLPGEQVIAEIPVYL